MSDLYRVRTAILGIAGGPEVATHFFQASAGTAQDAATAVRTFWDSLKTCVGNGYTFQVENAVELIDQATGQPTGLASTTNTVVTGTGGNNYVPSATQGVIQWRTGLFLGGREVRGRTYIPGLVTGVAGTTGLPGGPLPAAAVAAIGAIISPASSDFCIYSRAHRASASATSGALWNQFGVLRSRRT